MNMFFPGMSSSGFGNILPYQGTQNTDDQISNFLDLEQAELVRIKRYAQHWRFYHTRHWSFDRDDGSSLVTANYAKLVVDKAVSWQTKNGVERDYPEATKAVIQPYLEEVWEYNSEDIFLVDTSLTGSVTGDVFILVTFAEPTDIARRLNPNSQGQIKVDLLGSDQVFPTWDPLNADRMTSVRIETVFYDHHTRQRPIGGAEHTQSPENITVRRFTQIITDSTIIEQYEGGPPIIRENILGEIPVVHIKNLNTPRDSYGLSDLDPALTLQQELNEKATDNSDIIHYNAGPTTVITGAKASDIEKGANSIWSGLPENARVQNLEMKSDLNSIQQYILMIRKWLLEITETPEVLIEQPNVSNTSAAALHMMHRPIIDKTKRKLPLYEKGLQQVNYFILRIATTLGHIHLPHDLCKNCKGRIVEIYDEKTGMMKKKCFEIDDNFAWLDPEEKEVIHLRAHSLGYEVTESPMRQVREEHMQMHPSYWDPEKEQGRQEYEDSKLRESDQVETAARKQQPQQIQTGPDGQQKGRMEIPNVSTPKVKAEPPKIQGEMSFPKEPEDVELSTVLVDPMTGQQVQVITETRKLVPSGCKRPMYLNPYQVKVKYNDAMPRDEALDLQQYMQMRAENIVSSAWIRRQRTDIDPDEYAKIIQELREEERDRARPEGVVPEDRTDAGIREQALGKAKPGVGPESSDITRAMKSAGPNAPKGAV